MQLLATTNGGLEPVAAAELYELTGAEATRHHRGVVAFEGTVEDVYELHYRARSLHRIMAVLVDTPVAGLDDIYATTADAPVADRLPDATFGVVGTRHGTHEFTSMDVADRVGQAVIDAYRGATGTRLPVDLDDPTVRLEAYLYDERFTLAVDLTGESLHRRPYRVCEHDAPLRGTLAYQLLRLADYSADDRLVDPMAGSATIPIEAALDATDTAPRPDLDPAFTVLPRFDGDRFRRRRTAHAPRDVTADITAHDNQTQWRECARENREAAGLEDEVDIVAADARETPLDADCVVTNLPFGIRVTGDLRRLYSEFAERVMDGSVDRLVALTTKPELLPLSPDEQHDIPYGRIDASVIVWRR